MNIHKSYSHTGQRSAIIYGLIFFITFVLGSTQSYASVQESVDSTDLIIDQSVESSKIKSEAKFANDRVLVKFKPNINEAERSKIIRAHSTDASDIKGTGVKILKVKKGDSVENVISQITARYNDKIEYVQADTLAPLTMLPNDPKFVSQWEKTKTNTHIAWDTTTGDPNMIIAIADTGVNCKHADLSCVAGWNVASNTSLTTDFHGHGTKVAGVAAAQTNNAIGVAGQVWNSKIMPVRVTNDPTGYAYCSVVAKGVVWAADHGAKIVNVSLDVSNCLPVMDAGKYLREKGGLLVLGAGNSGTDRGFVASPDIIVASGIKSTDTLYSWSSFGNQVDVAAPGCVITTTRGGGYGSYCGTSYASPMTAGTLALIFAANPALTPTQAESILFSTARDLGTAGWDTKYGWGAIDAGAAVLQAKNMMSTTTPTL